MCVISKPDVVQGNIELKTEFAEPREKIRVSLFDPNMTISEPQKSSNLKNHEYSSLLVFFFFARFILAFIIKLASTEKLRKIVALC